MSVTTLLHSHDNFAVKKKETNKTKQTKQNKTKQKLGMYCTDVFFPRFLSTIYFDQCENICNLCTCTACVTCVDKL